MTSEVKMPVVAHRSRVPSEPGMLGHYPWSYLDGAPRLSQSSYERELLVLQSDALAAIEAANARTARAISLLEDLHALVWGECPCLLNEDSGGNGMQDVEIRSAIESFRSLAKEAP